MSNSIPIENLFVFGNLPSSVFYKTKEWRRLRYEALTLHGSFCQLCGASAKDKVRIHVDHIKPRSIYPQLCLDVGNLQILCETCHAAKGVEFIDNFTQGRMVFQPLALREVFRVCKQHMVLDHRPPKSTKERDFFGSGIRSLNKGSRRRWKRFVNFCFLEQKNYSQAAHVRVHEFVESKAYQHNTVSFARFLQSPRGIKDSDDFAFDISDCVFPLSIHELLADDQKAGSKGGHRHV